MPKDGTDTRHRIMDASEPLILAHGFSGTSVDAIVKKAGVTKGAFFHHFPSKTELGRALVDRWADSDESMLADFMARAERLSRDPVQQLLIVVGLFEETMSGLSEPYPGCLLATTVTEAELFDQATHARVRKSVEIWRETLVRKLREVAAIHPPGLEVDLDAVADMLWSTFEGAFILSKTMQAPDAVSKQLRQYRNYLELLFGGGRRG